LSGSTEELARVVSEAEVYDPGPRWQVRYWTIFVGQSISLIGSALTQFVLIWWITENTRSVKALSIAGLAALLPQALLGPVGGTFADRYSRRWLMVVADLISACCMAVLIALFLTERVELLHIYALLFARSAMQAFQAPAAAASTPMLVPTAFVSRASGLTQMVQGMMAMAAAPLGALAISLMPIGWALGIDIITATLGIVPLLFYRIPQNFAADSQGTGVWAEFREGVRTVWDNPGLRRLYGLLGLIVLAIMPSFTLVALLVKEHFEGGPADVALMEGLSGLGMMGGGIVVAAMAPRRHMIWILLGLTASCFAMAFASLTPGSLFVLAVVWWVISGVAFAFGNGPLTALLQLTIPNHLQGRVLSLLSTMMGLAAPIGLAIAIPVGELIGVRWLFVLMGVLGGLASLAGFLSPPLLNMRVAEAAAMPDSQ
jgi:DHA3 family macrolide efflux protein-like MFS transporter